MGTATRERELLIASVVNISRHGAREEDGELAEGGDCIDLHTASLWRASLRTC
jgi:hypothetical protein